ncbi:tripartite tricarboxylate transporter substrate binding protein (plasmid) [Cupriavidus sp. KK10]|jgi:tripartite-type tricarboxylate transporter receptor subunit TctC|uniref:Bug family tripartite tricarboxylate transporter substrate binding protein n=1 Tax=Cupriavidus sp. KK10 TaxID=1478019 RepID=UPI001BADC153|nr:tripartite tricarboxylate transporter substrate binding protein [Cupriavidus sp. KK10]QUN32393.1 tripartite tricarboxylate transporter substrate binding protein [Cupriavidus sp. KK10]
MKKSIALFLCTLVTTVSVPSHAHDSPTPRRLIVPYTSGGGSDMLSRALGQKLSQALGEPVIVENRPGANGYIAAGVVAKSPPDGHTLLVGGNALIIGPMLYSSHKLNTLKDFTPIASLVRVTLVLISSPGLPANNGREFVQMARKEKNLSYASPSPGIMFATEQIKALAGVDLMRVSYRGAPEGFIDVTSGRVSVMFDSVAAELPNIKSGRAKPLVVTSDNRHPLLPDVPTLVESGIAGYVEDNYIGVLGPAGMDPHVVDTLNAAMLKVLRDPEFKAFAEKLGFLPSPTSPRVFRDMLAATTARYQQIANQLGLKPE